MSGGLAKDFNSLRENRRRRFTLPGNLPGMLLGWFLVLAVAAPLTLVALFRFVETPGTVLMVQRAIEGERIRRDATSMEDISPHIVRAVIAAEDARFCAHKGFDVEAIQAAQKFNDRAEKRGSDRRRGASTISQQTAKNVFLWPQRSWVRKGLEAYFTVLIELGWPKRRIMEAYLNAAEWGHGVFGVEAAARTYFGKSAGNLTASEAARLAAVLPSPNKWSVKAPGPYVRKRAAAIEARMRAVRTQGLAACVLDGGGGKAEPAPGGANKPAPAPLPALPAAPTAGAESLVAEEDAGGAPMIEVAEPPP